MQRVCRISMASLRLCLVLVFARHITAFPMPLSLPEEHSDQDSDEDGRLVDEAYRKIVGDDDLEASLAEQNVDSLYDLPQADEHRDVHPVDDPLTENLPRTDEGTSAQLDMDSIPQGDQPLEHLPQLDHLPKRGDQIDDYPQDGNLGISYQEDQPVELSSQEDQLLKSLPEVDQIASSPHEDGDLGISYQEDQPVEILPQEDQQAENLPHGDQNFEDLPQGDMPMGGPVDENEAQGLETSSAPSMPINNSAAALRILHEIVSAEERRKRKLQTEIIRLRVWNYTRPNTEYSSTTTDNKTFVIPQRALDIVNSFSSGTMSDNYITERRSLFPSCDIPKNTDEELWVNGENGFSMNLLFNFNHSNLANGGREVLNATLRLYKIAQHIPLPLMSSCTPSNASGSEISSRPIPTTEQPAPTEAQQPIQSDDSPDTRDTSTSENRQVRVSVYLYTRALKKNRVKRKRLDSRMVFLNNDEWTAWDVSVAVKVYLESRRNFGLLVEVEDDHRCLLPANRIFKNINCSEEAATARPMPFLFMTANRERRPAAGSGKAFSFNENFYPLMDVITALPSEETPFLSTGTSFPFDISPLSELQQLPSSQQMRHSTSSRVQNGHFLPEAPPLQDGHRHRHGDDAQGNHRRRRKPVNNTEESLDLRSFIIPQRTIMTAEQHRQALQQR